MRVSPSPQMLGESQPGLSHVSGFAVSGENIVVLLVGFVTDLTIIITVIKTALEHDLNLARRALCCIC